MRMNIVVEVEGPDPKGTDPHEVAEDIFFQYEEFHRVNQDSALVEFVSAEWLD